MKVQLQRLLHIRAAARHSQLLSGTECVIRVVLLDDIAEDDYGEWREVAKAEITWDREASGVKVDDGLDICDPADIKARKGMYRLALLHHGRLYGVLPGNHNPTQALVKLKVAQAKHRRSGIIPVLMDATGVSDAAADIFREEADLEEERMTIG